MSNPSNAKIAPAVKEISGMVQAMPHLLDAGVTAVFAGGIPHVPARSVCSVVKNAPSNSRWRDNWGARAVAPQARVTLREALVGCPECLASATNSAFASLAAFDIYRTLFETSLRAQSIRKVTKSTSASAVAKRRVEVAELLRVTTRIGANAGPTAPFVQEVLEQLRFSDDVLKALGNDPETIEKVKTKVKELMVPKRFAGLVELDETPHLVGISRLPYGCKNQVTAAIDAFAIRNDAAGIVLLAPAYVYAFLLQQLFSKPSSTTLVVGYPAPEDPAVCEVAAGIWDPEGASSQACMRTSIEAAHALV